MAYIPIQIAGGTYSHNDLSLSAQRTINFLPQIQDSSTEKSEYILESFYGLKTFCAGTGLNRGLFVHRNILYHLHGTTLSSIDSAGVRTTLDAGTIVGDGRAIFSGNGSLVVIVASSVAYTWNPDTTTLTTASDPDFETPNSVATINSQSIYDGDGGRFGVSDVGVPLTIDGLNYGTAEYKADNLQRVYAYITNALMMGEKSIEQWWNSGTGNPPFDRIEGSIINVGLGAIHSVADDDENVYFFADDNQVYVLRGTVVTPILPKVIVREIEGFTTKTDAVGWTMIIDGQWFYVLKFQTADRTFIYPRNGEWFELSSGLTGGRYNGDAYAYAYNKHLIADEDGDVFEMDLSTYTEDSAVIRRTRTLSPIHSGLFGQHGKEIEIKYLVLNGKTGTGTLTGQGSDPEIIMQYANDGENFDTELRAKVGKLGKKTVVYFDIGDSAENWIFRFITTDPVYNSWHSAAIEAEIGI